MLLGNRSESNIFSKSSVPENTGTAIWDLGRATVAVFARPINAITFT